MDWFTHLEAPTQVAIVGIVAGFITAAAAVLVAIINNRRSGGGKAEITAMTMDASVVKLVAAAIEALNVTLTEQNRIASDTGDEAVGVIDRLIRELVELRRELRAISDKLRS